MGAQGSPWESEETEGAKAACSSALIAGMVCGQLLFGSLGDIIGLDTAMAATITTQLIGTNDHSTQLFTRVQRRLWEYELQVSALSTKASTRIAFGLNAQNFL